METQPGLEKTPLLDAEVADAAARSVLCWLATVDAAGQPNVSPKEVFAVFDAQHLVVADIASPNSVRNVAATGQVSVAFVDVFVQKGFKVAGVARVVAPGDEEFALWAAPLVELARPRFPIRGVIVVRAERVDEIVAPSYRLYPETTTVEGQIAAAMRTYGVQPG